jgi:thioredoxin 1
MKKNSIIVGLLLVAIALVLGIKNSKKDEVQESVTSATQTQALPTLLELGSVNCTPCKMMMPILDELRETYAKELRVEFIDVWKNQEVGAQYKIRAIPTQIFFDAEGNELFRHEGFFPKKDIIKKWSELGIVLTASGNNS